MNAHHKNPVPPELTGDTGTDWALWQLSLTLAEIARNVQVQPELQCSGQMEVQSDCR